MGLTRLSSDSSLPIRNWVKLTVTLVSDGVAAAFAAVPKLAIRALVYAPSGNAAPVIIGPDSAADVRTLQPGDEYLIESEPGHAFDLAPWFAVATTASGTTLKVIYQPA